MGDQPMNEHLKAARAALIAWQKERGISSGRPLDWQVECLLADIRQLCDSAGMIYGVIDDHAYTTYLEEK